MNNINHIIQFLNRQGHAITIEYNGMKKQIPNISRDRFLYTKEHILNESESIESFLKSLPKSGFFDGTVIHFYAPNGSGKRKVNTPVTLNFESMEQQTPRPTNTIHNFQYPNYGMHGSFVHPAQSKLEALQEKHEALKERYDEIREDYKQVKSELRISNEELGLKKIELATIEKQHEIDLKRVESGSKSMMESEGFTKLMEQLPKLVAPLMKKGTTQPPIQQPIPDAMGGSLELSEDKIDFIGLIKKPYVRDEDVNTLYLIYELATKNQEFGNSLSELIKKHENADTTEN